MIKIIYKTGIELYNTNFYSIYKDGDYGSKNKYMIWYLLVSDKNIVGGIGINTRPSSRPEFNIVYPDIAVSWFYILPEFRRQGYAIKLFEKIFNHGNKLTLTTNDNESSKEAIYLYTKYGFKPMGKKGRTTYWYLSLIN